MRQGRVELAKVWHKSCGTDYMLSGWEILEAAFNLIIGQEGSQLEHPSGGQIQQHNILVLRKHICRGACHAAATASAAKTFPFLELHRLLRRRRRQSQSRRQIRD